MTNVNYDNAKATVEAANAKTEQDKKNRAVFEQIVKEHGLIAPVESNFQVLVSFSNGVLTKESVEFLLNNPTKGPTLAFTEERLDLLGKIIHAKRQALKKAYTSYDEQQDRKDLANKSRLELQAVLNDFVKRYKLTDQGDAQQFLKEVRKREDAFGFRGKDGVLYPRLLSTICPPGQVQSVPTRDYLRHLAKNDLFEFKRACQRWSSEQVTLVMNS